MSHIWTKEPSSPSSQQAFHVNPHDRSLPNESTNREHFTVNMAKTDSYKDSAVPYIQRILNAHVKSQRQYMLHFIYLLPTCDVNDNHVFIVYD